MHIAVYTCEIRRQLVGVGCLFPHQTQAIRLGEEHLALLAEVSHHLMFYLVRDVIIYRVHTLESCGRVTKKKKKKAKTFIMFYVILKFYVELHS